MTNLNGKYTLDEINLQARTCIEKGDYQVLDQALTGISEADEVSRAIIKYARMENSIPPLSENPLIDQIVEIEIAWAKELAAKYPKLHGPGAPH